MRYIRVFASKKCSHCKELKNALTKIDLEVKYIDAFDEKNQKLCDMYDVDDLPHVQFIDKDQKLIVKEFPGVWGEEEIQDVLDFADQF